MRRVPLTNGGYCCVYVYLSYGVTFSSNAIFAEWKPSLLSYSDVEGNGSSHREREASKTRHEGRAYHQNGWIKRQVFHCL